MAVHFKTICIYCKKVMSQCRCASPNKVVKYGTCDDCKEARKVVAEQT